MQPIDFAMIGMLVALVCFTTLAYRIGRSRGWDAGYWARRDEERREREAPTLEQIRNQVAASARLGY